PIFWIAVLLKEFGAIQFNDFLANPQIPIWVILLTGLISGVVFMSMLGGNWRRRLITFGSAFVAGAGLLTILAVTDWFARPTVGIIGIIVTGVAAAIGTTAISTGLSNRRALLASFIVVAIW